MTLQGQCLDWTQIQSKTEHTEELTCSICLQCMVKPYRLNCSQHPHSFGQYCIKQWRKKGQKGKQCPLCRRQFTELSPDASIFEKISSLEAFCPHCETKMKASQYQGHKRQCKMFIEKKMAILKEIVSKQKEALEQQINPHLRSDHTEIWQKYVENWTWLDSDSRDWKWWWWANNPWWHNQSCPTCNTLWHKYQNIIDPLEVQRVDLITELNICPLKP